MLLSVVLVLIYLFDIYMITFVSFVYLCSELCDHYDINTRYSNMRCRYLMGRYRRFRLKFNCISCFSVNTHDRSIRFRYIYGIFSCSVLGVGRRLVPMAMEGIFAT